MLSSNSPNSNVNHDFIAELKKATGAGVNSLKRTRKPAEGGQMTMVYSFGKDETMLNGNESTDKNVSSIVGCAGFLAVVPCDTS